MKNLKLLRTQRKLSQTDMAKIVNMSVRGYQNIEYGVNEASYSTLLKLADYFGCSIDYLLGHQTATILQLDLLSKSQQELFGLMKKMTDKQVDKLIGYANSLLSVPLDDVVDKIYNEGRK